MADNKKKLFNFKNERTGSTIVIIIGMLLFLAAIITDFRPGYTIFTAVISAMGSYELLKAAGARNKLLFGINSAVSALIVVLSSYKLPESVLSPSVVPTVISFYALALLMIAVIFNKTVKYTDAVMTLFSSVALPYAFSCFIRLNDIALINERFTHLEGIFLVMMVFSCSWMTDSFAFLVGRKIGKHKITPNISPKKSLEGAIFGVLATVCLNLAVLGVFDKISLAKNGVGFMADGGMKYVWFIPISILLSVLGMFGDLAASVLKRNVGIKDYSNLMPGHGGIMDRFDSTLFVLPVIYGIFAIIYS